LLPTHWLLDYFAHRPDLRLYPGGPKVGLGMWNSLPLTLIGEFGLFIAGLILYLSATRSKGGWNYGFWSFVLFLAAIYRLPCLERRLPMFERLRSAFGSRFPGRRGATGNDKRWRRIPDHDETAR